MTAGQALLAIGGGASLLAAAAHLACIAIGPRAYLAMGAGRRLADAAAQGRAWPALATAAIAAVLAVWGAFGLSGAGLIGRLPLLRAGLVGIAAIYLLRGLVLFAPGALRRPDLSTAFLTWSSAVVLTMGLLYAAGTWLCWHRL